mgnify:FL=1|tara:strand:+ start:7603 stop:8535 length:933 start_codon:yes stop_codon:yes gene_type:complete
MFSVIFPGQGSQAVGMAKNLYENFNYVKELFEKSDDILNQKLSKIILEGSKQELDLTENTQPSIFLVSYCIAEIIKKETKFDLNKAEFFAGHSLGEYTALAVSGSLSFEKTIYLLKKRGKSMQSASPNRDGGMIAILGSDISVIEKILKDNVNKYKCYIANDNSVGQVVISGKNSDLENLILDLKEKTIKNIKLPVSAPFHCNLMRPATEIMKKEIENTHLIKPKNKLISNVTAYEALEVEDIKNLLIKQIESPVRWRESILYMISKKVTNFIEIGPGKVLSGLIKRIDKNVNISSINNIEDLKSLDDKF